MFKNNFINQGTSNLINSVSLQEAFLLLIHAFSAGCILAFFTIISSYLVNKYSCNPTKDAPLKIQDLLLESSNMLMLCVSMATLMIIVDNNLARAFAIGAAVALIRFKGKLAGKTGDTSLLFAVLCGMSIGIGQTKFAYLVTGMYLLIKSILILAIFLTRVRSKKDIDEN